MVRPLESDELEAVEAAAQAFYSSSAALDNFSLTRFVEVWTHLLKTGDGVIYAYDVDGVIVGAIGGACFQDVNSADMIAQEMFWFIMPEFRGGGVRLYHAFEKWSREHGADAIQMGHLVDSMPQKLENFYIRSGYELIEMRYSKRLKVA